MSGAGIKLLDANYGDVVNAGVAAGLQQVVIDLARTQNDPAHVLVQGQVVGFRQHAAEAGVGPHLAQVGNHQLVTQQGLR